MQKEKEVSREQALELMAKLSTNVDWAQLGHDVIQYIIDDPTGSGREFTRFLANGGRVQTTTTGGIVVPHGGRTHIVSVPVNESRDWNEAVRTAGPNTPAYYEVWKVGEQYPPIVGVEPSLQQIILVNFRKFIRSEDVLAWGKENRLRPITPRACLAIGEHCPILNRDLGLEYMAVVTLGAPCSFGGMQGVVSVRFDGAKRRVDFLWFGHVWSEICWFAFVRE